MTTLLDAGSTSIEVRTEGPAPAPTDVQRLRAELGPALMDPDHLDHHSAVQRLRDAYEGQFPEEPAAEPAEAEIAAVRAEGIASMLTRHGGIVEADEAEAVAGWASSLGLSAGDLEPIWSEYIGRLNENGTLREWREAEVLNALGGEDRAFEVIDRARANLAKIDNPELAAWLDDTGLGNSPRVIELFAGLENG